MSGNALDRLTWGKHIVKKTNEINLKYKGLHWLLGRNSKLSLDNKLLIYKTTVKPIQLYGIELWGSACDSSVSIIQRVQNNILKQISNSPCLLKISELHDTTRSKYADSQGKRNDPPSNTKHDVRSSRISQQCN